VQIFARRSSAPLSEPFSAIQAILIRITLSAILQALVLAIGANSACRALNKSKIKNQNGTPGI
jgi:hypothetical protein